MEEEKDKALAIVILMFILFLVGILFGFLWCRGQAVVQVEPEFKPSRWLEPGSPVMWHPDGAIMIKANGKFYVANGRW